MWNDTRITKLLGIKYPIIQGPFGGGLSSTVLASTVSNLGGMGSFGAQPLTPEKILEVNAEIKSKTTKPYALNIWVSNKDERADSYSEEEFQKLCQLFKPYFDELSIPLPAKPTSLGSQFAEQVQAVLEAQPPVMSFVFGIPSPEILEACRRKNIKTIGTATTAEEAVALEAAGVDAIAATGLEAGGHRVSFMKSAEASLTGTFALIPLVADRVKIPVIAAGGIADGRGVAAALTLGADAVQIGTAFLACEESNATPAHKAKLFSKDARETVLTKMFSGRLARGMKSKLSEALAAHENNFAPYPIQRLFVSSLSAAAVAQGKSDLITFWSGQIAPILKHKKTEALFHALVSETQKLLA
ncbi:nitronate monooxygenase [Cytophagales bacterium WSM2-2]|nr:nitronate monooxygenase [Cytophagales bacterium WSM2-2]